VNCSQMKNILFIALGQFGTHTGTYHQCLLLKAKYKITYIGLNEGYNDKQIEGIKIIHIDPIRSGNGIVDRIRIYKAIREELKCHQYDLIIINYFLLCSIVLLIKKPHIVVAIKSSFIFPNKLKKTLYDMILFVEARLFKYITTLSESLVRYLHLPQRTSVIPLGGPSFPFYKKTFNSLRFLYVGTFHDRKIDNTIHAYSKFFNEYRDIIDIHYTIIGFGSNDEIVKLVDTIKALGMDKNISYKGAVRYPEIKEYLKEHNVGISYIPITDYYECQPPTKTFEYLLSGMAVLATGTKENIKVINNKNGIIMGESVEDIYNGFRNIYINRSLYDSESIQQEAQKYSWDSIITNNLIPYIESITSFNK
jgi:hypothetical protein